MDGEKISVKIRVLSGEELFAASLGGRFIIDLDTIDEHRSRYILDYNHNEEEVIGQIDALHVEDGALVGTAEIFSAQEGDRAEEVIKRILAGTPYEVSPLIHTALGVSEVLDDGEVATVNGREVTGPLTIYRQTPLRGVAVCPYGTDKYTGITALKLDKNDVLTLSQERATEMEEEKIKVEETEEIKEAAHPDLEEMIELFGIEDGVAYFREGLTVEEAKERDYQALRQARADRLAAEKKEVVEESTEEVKEEEKEKIDEKEALACGDKEEDKKELNALNAKISDLSEQIEKLSGGLTALKATIGESAPLSAGPVGQMPKEADKRPAVFRMADKIKQQGIKKG